MADQLQDKDKAIVNPTSDPPRLLSLPLKIRRQIWREAIQTQIFLYPHISDDDNRNRHISFRRLPFQYFHDVHYFRNPNQNPWLLTNRQIYTEARPLVDTRPPCVHMRNPSSFMSYIKYPREDCNPALAPGALQSMCINLIIYVKDAGLGGQGNSALLLDSRECWLGHLDGSSCACFRCVNGLLTPMEYDTEEYFEGLRELTLNVSFICAKQPLMGQGTQIWNMLTGKEKKNEQRGGVAGNFVDGDEKFELFVRQMCKELPLRRFLGKKLDCVDVRVNRWIEHFGPKIHPYPLLPITIPFVWSPQRVPFKQCWCYRRSVDQMDNIGEKLEEAIRTTLMNGRRGDF